MIYLAVFILVLLAIASVFIAYQIKQNSTSERLNNKKRLFSWWLIFVICLFVFFLSYSFGTITILCLIISLLFWVMYEFCQLFKIDISIQKILSFIIIVFILSVLVTFYPLQSRMLFMLTIISAFVIYLVPVRSHFYFPLFSFYCCFSLFSIYLIAQLSSQMQLDYPYLFLSLFFMTAVNDIAQYISGKVWGKTPVAPTISPNKTMAGVWGGIIVSSLFGVLLLPKVLNISILEAYLMGSLLGFAGLWGDLIVSKLKRGLQIKDTGSSISGHGGILDRVDSLLLTAPVLGLLLLSGGYL